ncbi:MAG: ABC transporter ATP-binding protein [Bacteroidetes bacterium]|nr:ABC transporter ATP-binding protein [Bacteroidota bacterium]
MNDTTPIQITIKNLTIGFKNEVVSNFSTQLSGGDFIALIGNNGTGKTTLLKTIAGITPSIKGSVLIGEKKISILSISDKAKIISYVNTQRIENSYLTVQSFIEFGRYPHSNLLHQLSDKDQEIIDNAIQTIGIGHLVKKPINELSDGEYQKAQLAMTLAQNTSIILLDEPTSFLDYTSKIETIRLLKKIAVELKKIIVFSSHDLELLQKHCTTFWLINNKSISFPEKENIIP